MTQIVPGDAWVWDSDYDYIVDVILAQWGNKLLILRCSSVHGISTYEDIYNEYVLVRFGAKLSTWVKL